MLLLTPDFGIAPQISPRFCSNVGYNLAGQTFDELMAGRTSFVVAHRLSTIRNADCILVMRDSQIIERGTYEELFAANGFYAGLYNSQWVVEG